MQSVKTSSFYNPSYVRDGSTAQEVKREAKNTKFLRNIHLGRR